MKFDKCPRCNGEWGDVNKGEWGDVNKDDLIPYYLVCKECRMYRRLFGNGEISYSLELGKCNILWWYFTDNTMQCSYILDKNDMSYMYTQCTILPFDISEDVLKLYLTFS